MHKRTTMCVCLLLNCTLELHTFADGCTWQYSVPVFQTGWSDYFMTTTTPKITIQCPFFAPGLCLTGGHQICCRANFTVLVLFCSFRKVIPKPVSEIYEDHCGDGPPWRWLLPCHYKRRTLPQYASPYEVWSIVNTPHQFLRPFHILIIRIISIGNLLHNRRRGEPKDVMTSLSSVDVAPLERSCTFFYRIYPKENIPASCRFFIRKNNEISRTLRLMHDGRSFDKILPRQVGYFGTWINCKQP
jgi:hypothetical protein